MSPSQWSNMIKWSTISWQYLEEYPIVFVLWWFQFQIVHKHSSICNHSAYMVPCMLVIRMIYLVLASLITLYNAIINIFETMTPLNCILFLFINCNLNLLYWHNFIRSLYQLILFQSNLCSDDRHIDIKKYNNTFEFTITAITMIIETTWRRTMTFKQLYISKLSNCDVYTRLIRKFINVYYIYLGLITTCIMMMDIITTIMIYILLVLNLVTRARIHWKKYWKDLMNRCF